MDKEITLELSRAEFDLLRAILDKVNIPANLAKTFVGVLDKMEKIECQFQPSESK